MSNGAVAVKSISCGGIKIDDQLRIGGMMYMEELYDQPISKITFDGSIKMGFNVMTALAIQRNPEMAESDIKKLISGITDDEYATVLSKIHFGTPVKNPKTPAKRKRKKRATKKK